jgi:ABC-type transporter Mla subunit MlaD
MTDIKARIDENGGGIKGVFNTYMEAYKSLWSMGFNAIDSATGGALSRVVGTVGARLGEIRATFTNLASEALSWGSDMINNFASGITSHLQSLAATVSSMASTIRSYLHFSEPDKGPLADFHTYAPDMMKLFASGIENNLGLVESAVDNVAASVGRTMEQNTYTSNVGGVNIVVNARDGQSAEEIAEIVQMKINRDVMLSARAMA